MFRIYDGRIEFFQWDLDRKIIVSDPAIDEVHFCNKTDDCSLVVKVYELNGQRVANVPNILLQSNWDIRVYGYCGSCYTKQAARFKVVGRTKPADYIYTETEVRTLDYLESRLDEIEAMAKGAVGGKSFMDYAALIETLNAASNKDYAQAQHMLIKTLGVPDVWVYEVSAEYKPYEYADDQTFAEALVNELPQVGYYVLSALETQKVNLDDYVKKTDYPSTNGTKAGVIKISNGANGLYLNPNNGLLTVMAATNAEIDSRQKYNHAIVPTNLDYAWKVAATDNKEEWTDEEKAAACETIGAAPRLNPNANGFDGVWTATENGGLWRLIQVNAYTAQPWYIPAYMSEGIGDYTNGGYLLTETPTRPYHAANKKYVDENKGTKLYLHELSFDNSATNKVYVVNRYPNPMGYNELRQLTSSEYDVEKTPISWRYGRYNIADMVIPPMSGLGGCSAYYFEDVAITHVPLGEFVSDAVTEL